MSKLRYFLVIFLCLPTFMFAGFSQVNGVWSPEEYQPTTSVQEHFDIGCQALTREEYQEALINFMVILYHFQSSPFYNDSLYYSGVVYYHLEEFDYANRQFSRYLNQAGKLKHFDDAFEYKYCVAEEYKKGKKKHLFGKFRLPRIASGKHEAMELYDEIIASLPGKDLAIKALYGKADLHRRKKEYRECIDTLQALYRAYPRHELAAESYVLIAEVFREQSVNESQNPDLIALAELNFKRFRKAFPSDERQAIVESHLVAMQENFAQSLFDTGRFYERKKKPHASAIYYRDTLNKYPKTEAAKRSQDRLVALGLASPDALSVEDQPIAEK